MEKKREKDKLTVLIDRETKEKYKEHCNSKGLIISRQIELFMEEELRKIERGKEEKKGK